MLVRPTQARLWPPEVSSEERRVLVVLEGMLASVPQLSQMPSESGQFSVCGQEETG